MPEQQKPKHTPGPWKKYGRVDAGGNFTVAGENPRVGTIATIPKQRQRNSYYDARSPEEMEATAWLIAAAPELLEALKRIHKEHGWCWLAPIIARAEGRP